MAFNLFNERLKPLYDHTSDGVIILDGSMNILHLNASAEEILGWKASEKIGKRFPLEELIHLNSGETVQKSHAAFSSTETIHDLEMEVTLSHGNKLLLPAISFPMTSGGGEQFYGIILENILLKYGVSEKLIKKERLDEMTGLLHKEYFEQVAGDEMKRMKKHGGTLGAILVQIGNLENIQEKSGMLKASETVKRVGKLVKGNSRDVDLVCHYSENEFMVLLVNSDQGKMNIILSRLKEKIEHSNQIGQFPIPVRINVGNILLSHQYDEIFKSVKLSLEKFV